MHRHLTVILDALHEVKLLPRQPGETDVAYGYVAAQHRTDVIAEVVRALKTQGYEVHQCTWADEAVLLALDGTEHPLAIRLTASVAERYNLYALSRPRTAQALWQWAHMMFREYLRAQRNQ